MDSTSTSTTSLGPARFAPWDNSVHLSFHHCVDNKLPDFVKEELISCAFVFVFDQKRRMLMGKHAKRGYDIPGGHVEEKEKSVDAATRELEEEVGVKIQSSQLRLFGYERLFHFDKSRPVSLKDNHPWPKSYFTYYMINNIDSDDNNNGNTFKPRPNTEESHEDMQEIKWFTVEELHQHKWFIERPHVLPDLLKSIG